jgi:hypothetical protein
MKRFAIIAALFATTVAMAGDRGLIRLESYPTVSVADARSTVTVTAEIRDTSGKPVPNGTQVLFSCTLGTFRQPVVTTENGYARAILKAGGIAGTARITATALAVNATSTLDIEFFSDRSLLSTAKEYIEVVTPGYLMYSMDSQLLGAAAPSQGVKVRYREIEVEADDIQFDIANYGLRARKAHLKMKNVDREFDELFIKLNARQGLGTTSYEGMSAEVGFAGFVPILRGTKKQQYGLVSVSATGIAPPKEAAPAGTFEFFDLSESVTQISAKKAIIFPRKLVQFQRAEVYVANNRVMRLPLYQVSLNSTTPLITEQIVQVQDNQVSVNYPYYLSMGPGETSLLRFRMGENYGRGGSVNRGAFLDYELNWNKGDEFTGGLSFTGIARQDWSVGLRQYIRMGDRTTTFVQLDSPAGKSIYGSLNVGHNFNGFSVNFNGNSSRSFRGFKYDDDRISFNGETDGSKIRSLPVTMYYGFNLYDSRTSVGLRGQQATVRKANDFALTARAQMSSVTIDRASSLNASVSTNLRPRSFEKPGLLGTLTLSRQLSNASSLLLTYDYADDIFESALLGKHRLSFQGFFSGGRTSFSLFGARSLDVDRLSLYGDLGYELSPLWRATTSYTFDQFRGDRLLDFSIGLSYKIGWRDIGVTWSQRTRRFGIQLLGASIN